MTLITNSDLRTRIEAILGTITQINTIITTDDCLLSDADLPAVIVMIRQGARSRTNQSWWNVERTVQIGALFTRLCGDTVAEQRAQMTAAEAMLEIIPDTFERLDRLALNHVLLKVSKVSDMTDSGLETRPWGEDVMYAATYEFIVTLMRN